MRKLFTYPNYGTPDGYPDYTAHSGQVVDVLGPVSPEELCRPALVIIHAGNEAVILLNMLPPYETGLLYTIRADDRWEGQAFETELSNTLEG